MTPVSHNVLRAVMALASTSIGDMCAAKPVPYKATSLQRLLELRPGDPSAVAAIRAERARRKAEAFARRTA